MIVEYLIVSKPILILSLVLLIFTSLWVLAKNYRRYMFGMIFSAIVLVTTVSIYFSIRSYEGWPVVAYPSENFTLHWYVIDEPNTIYAWLTNDTDPKPRAYALPYTRTTHQNLDKTRKALKKGDATVRGFKAPSETDDAKNLQSYRFETIIPQLAPKYGTPPPPPRAPPTPPQKFT